MKKSKAKAKVAKKPVVKAVKVPAGLGKKLSAYRTKQGLSQMDMAKKLKCSQGTISLLERGSNPSKPLMARIEKLLG